MKIHFGEWDDELHETDEQQERLKKAASSKTSPEYVDVYEEAAEFEGSGKKPYRTTLISSEANQETALRLFLYAIQKLTVSCRLFCTFEQDIYEFLTNANNLSSLGLQYVGDINSYTQCMSIPQMRGIIEDCDLELKFNRRSKAATIFAQNDTLKKYVLNKYLYIKFEKDYVKYYIELFHEVFNQFPQMNKSGLTDIAYIPTSKELSSKS